MKLHLFFLTFLTSLVVDARVQLRPLHGTAVPVETIVTGQQLIDEVAGILDQPLAPTGHTFATECQIRHQQFGRRYQFEISDLQGARLRSEVWNSGNKHIETADVQILPQDTYIRYETNAEQVSGDDFTKALRGVTAKFVAFKRANPTTLKPAHSFPLLGYNTSRQFPGSLWFYLNAFDCEIAPELF